MFLLLACGPSPTLAVGPDDLGVWDDSVDSSGGEDSVESLDSLDSPVDTDTDTGGGGGGCDDVVADDVGYADLFDTTRVHTAVLTVGEFGKDALLVDPSTYVLADLELDGHPLPGVGLRFRGPTEQMRWDGKPGLRIGFRSFDACDTYAGLTHLTLDGMSLDPAAGRLVVESSVLEAAGRLVPRASFVSVTVDGEPQGLYTNVETVDEEFLVHHGLEADTVIWEGGDGADFTTGSLDEWSDVDSDGDPAFMEALAELLLTVDGDVYAEADVWVDMADFVGMWAALASVGESTSYPYDTDDIYLLQSPSDPRLRFVPWGLDGGWEPDFGYDHVDGMLGLRCIYDTTCTSELGMAIEEGLTTLEGIDVRGTAEAVFHVTDAALAEDPYRPTTAAEVAAARASVLEQVDAWPAFVRAQVGS